MPPYPHRRSVIPVLLCCWLLLAATPAGAAAQGNAASASPETAVRNAPRDDLPALRRAYDRARTREYPGVDVNRALKAAARVFELADGGYAVLVGRGGVVAHRERDDGDGLFAGNTGDYWYVDARPSGDGVVMRIRRTAEPDPATSLDPETQRAARGPLVASATLDPEETWLAELTDSGAAYAIFFKRMDWLLARNNYWLYCRAAEEYVKMEKLAGGLDPLCLEAGDKRPSLR